LKNSINENKRKQFLIELFSLRKKAATTKRKRIDNLTKISNLLSEIKANKNIISEGNPTATATQELKNYFLPFVREGGMLYKDYTDMKSGKEQRDAWVKGFMLQLYFMIKDYTTLEFEDILSAVEEKQLEEEFLTESDVLEDLTVNIEKPTEPEAIDEPEPTEGDLGDEEKIVEPKEKREKSIKEIGRVDQMSDEEKTGFSHGRGSAQKMEKGLKDRLDDSEDAIGNIYGEAKDIFIEFLFKNAISFVKQIESVEFGDETQDLKDIKTAATADAEKAILDPAAAAEAAEAAAAEAAEESEEEELPPPV